MTADANAYYQGFLMGAALIIAIGAQNAFVLAQSIRRNYGLSVAALCALIDVLLIAAGVCGLGALVAGNETLRGIAALGGAGFLIVFGAKSLNNARKTQGLEACGSFRSGFASTLGVTLAVSLLNPHVYLDTVIMLGAVSGQFPGEGRYYFGMGAASASVVWFFSLSFAGSALAPFFKKPASWRAINLLVCGMVWWVAAGLLRDYFSG